MAIWYEHMHTVNPLDSEIDQIMKQLHTAQIQLISNQSHCLLRPDVRALHRSLMTADLFLFSRQISMQTLYSHSLSLLIGITKPLIIRFFLLFFVLWIILNENTMKRHQYLRRFFSLAISNCGEFSFSFQTQKISGMKNTNKSTMNEQTLIFGVKIDFYFKCFSLKVWYFNPIWSKINDKTKIFM